MRAVLRPYINFYKYEMHTQHNLISPLNGNINIYCSLSAAAAKQSTSPPHTHVNEKHTRHGI
jgi:hypothetical protein